MPEPTDVAEWLKAHKGILVAKSAIVCRNTYFGNNIIAKNSSLEYRDTRGYVPVELWIMSMVQAENTLRVEGEGMTKIMIGDSEVTLADLNRIAGKLIFGEYANEWPLTKILDIGGMPIKTSFGTEEIPPIPVHVHPHKTEAYFFPPVTIAPYNKPEQKVITRIGLKPDVTREEFKKRMMQFGVDDSMFELLNEFPIQPNTGWTVLEKTIHAPGPYVTFEIQRPADDYANASWRLGERLEETERNEKYKEHVLRENADNEDGFIDSLLDWNHTTDQTLKDRFLHAPQIIEEGVWGKRYRIFFDMFYGEGWEIKPNQSYTFKAKQTPQGGIVWSGKGEINENVVSQDGMNEFLIIPNTHVTIKNIGNETLYIYTAEPIYRP